MRTLYKPLYAGGSRPLSVSPVLVSNGVFVLTLTSWFGLAHSEEQKEVAQLPPVEVQGSPETPERTRSEAQARKEIERTPSGVTLIGSQEIKETRATALQDVLDFVPGIMVQPRFGNVADESQISIRGSGLRNNYHLRGLTLLLDGFPLNNADGFGDFEAAELLATKRIEVYKGTNALRFGCTLKPWNLDFFAEARNLTDKDYMSDIIVDDANGRFIEPGDGRAFYAGVTYRWQ